MNEVLLRNLTAEEVLRYSYIGELDSTFVNLIRTHIIYLESLAPDPPTQNDIDQFTFDYDDGKDQGFIEGYCCGYYDGFLGLPEIDGEAKKFSIEDAGW